MRASLQLDYCRMENNAVERRQVDFVVLLCVFLYLDTVVPAKENLLAVVSFLTTSTQSPHHPSLPPQVRRRVAIMKSSTKLYS